MRGVPKDVSDKQGLRKESNEAADECKESNCLQFQSLLVVEVGEEHWCDSPTDERKRAEAGRR